MKTIIFKNIIEKIKELQLKNKYNNFEEFIDDISSELEYMEEYDIDDNHLHDLTCLLIENFFKNNHRYTNSNYYRDDFRYLISIKNIKHGILNHSYLEDNFFNE